MSDQTIDKDVTPKGLIRFYEGDDPEAFAASIQAEFGFDPSEDERWGQIYFGPHAFVSYAFVCPFEHLGAVYDSGRWLVGS